MSAVDLTPSWSTTMQILILALKDGTQRGKDMATAELLRIGDLMDQAYSGNAPDVSSIQEARIGFSTLQLHCMDEALARAIDDLEHQIRNTNLDADYTPDEVAELKDKPRRWMGCRKAITQALEQVS